MYQELLSAGAEAVVAPAAVGVPVEAAAPPVVSTADPLSNMRPAIVAVTWSAPLKGPVVSDADDPLPVPVVAPAAVVSVAGLNVTLSTITSRCNWARRPK